MGTYYVVLCKVGFSTYVYGAFRDQETAHTWATDVLRGHEFEVTRMIEPENMMPGP